MLINKLNIRIRFILLILALLCSISFFSINWYLVKQFRLELNKQVQTIVNIYHNKLINEKVDSEYLLTTLIPLINDLDIPMIITTKTTSGDYSYQHINIDLENYSNNYELHEKLKKTIILMDKQNNPLPIIEVDGFPIIEIHYGDSVIIENLKWISFIEFGFVFFIIILFIISIYLILSSEKNFIYAGMAKEAAHQLGTPISSLMGWLELLNSNVKDKNKIYASMQEDVKKLDNISHKFNKIGSTPILKKINLISLLNEIIGYYNKKIPKSINTKIEFNNSYDYIYVEGDKVLLYWAFENIIKNSIDSLNKKNCKILLFLNMDNKYVSIDIIDNGKGILRKNKNKIFNPGYSTKNKGWGLGLNLSKRIIEKIHNGTLKLLSSNKIQTTFRIKLRISIS